jgi:hypothetical protein
MTAQPSRRTVLTGTAASAVAAAVPASAAVAKSAPVGALGTRYRDGIWSVATQMPRDARAWVDAARAAGLTIGLGYANGEPGVYTGYNDVPNDVRDFLLSWGNAIPTAEIVAELEGEQPGENDKRILELDAERRRLKARDAEIGDEIKRLEGTLPADLACGTDNHGWRKGFPLLDTSIPAVAKMCGDSICPCSSRPQLKEVRNFNRHTERLAAPGADRDRRRAEGRERIRHWIARQREQREAYRARGIDRLFAEGETIHDRIDTIEHEIVDTPADGPAGVRVKLAVALNIEDDSGDGFDVASECLEERGKAKVLADLDRMSQEGA